MQDTLPLVQTQTISNLLKQKKTHGNHIFPRDKLENLNGNRSGKFNNPFPNNSPDATQNVSFGLQAILGVITKKGNGESGKGIPVIKGIREILKKANYYKGF